MYTGNDGLILVQKEHVPYDDAYAAEPIQMSKVWPYDQGGYETGDGPLMQFQDSRLGHHPFFVSHVFGKTRWE